MHRGPRSSGGISQAKEASGGQWIVTLAIYLTAKPAQRQRRTGTNDKHADMMETAHTTAGHRQGHREFPF